jgi:ABC-type Mn2+/Zn2+ transport system ATPase subunit
VLAAGRWHWVLAVAGAGLSTPEVYGELDRLRASTEQPAAGAPDRLINALRVHDPGALGLLLANDLQAPALALRPELRRTLRVGGRPRRARRRRLRLRADLRVPVPVPGGGGAAGGRAGRGRRLPHGAGRVRTGPRRPGGRRRGRHMTAPLVSLENVSKAYATTVVLDGVSLGVAAGERTGVVGRNGGGKTTLLRIITGQEEPDAGRVARIGGLRIGCVDQRTDPPGSTIRDAVLAGYGQVHEWAGDAAVREVLGGLGLPRIGLDAPVERLSGGERRRVALAAALVARSDLLVLDEPTNHLDVEGVAWLAEHLKGRREALVVVTHDRWFLDEVSQQTWEVGDGHGPPVRGRILRVRAGPGRAGQAGGRVRGPAGRTCCARSWPGCAGAAGPDQQAAVPDRGRAGADRRRAAAAGLDPAAGVRRPAGSARACTTSRTSRSPSGDRTSARPRDLAARPGRPGRARRRQRGRQDHAAAPAARPAAAGPRDRPGGTDRPGRLSLPGRGRAAEHLRLLEAVEQVAGTAQPRRGRPVRVPAGRAGSASAPAGSGRRSPTCPAASGAGCSCSGCSWPSPTCCCWTSRPTTSTPTR